MATEKTQKPSKEEFEHDFEAELEEHLTKVLELLNDAMGHAQAAYHTAHDLQRKSNLDCYRTAIENLMDVGKEMRHSHNKIVHVKNSTDSKED